MPVVSASEWEAFLGQHPNTHLLQTAAWGDLKAGFGWDAVRVISGEAGAQILFRSLPLGFTFAYIPKGPVCESPLDHTAGKSGHWENLWAEIDRLCRQQRSILLKVEPDILLGDEAIETASPPAGFLAGRHAIQPVRTLIVPLEGDEAQILGRMKQKTRYNIRLALKKGVVIRPSDDVDLFHGLMRLTGQREAFGVHSREYFLRAYDLFYPRGGCELLLAEYDHEPLAALMIFTRGRRAWYFFGASSDIHRERMPAYLLQWEAMRWAQEQGCVEYDLWGVPDADLETLESNFTKRTDGLWGVYRFKRGFGGRLCRSPDPWDRVYRPQLYRIYQWWMNRRFR